MSKVNRLFFLCHFEQSARPGVLLVVSYKADNPGLGQGEIFIVPPPVSSRFLPEPALSKDAKTPRFVRSDRSEGVEMTMGS